jgi:hypothetical protein
MLQAHRYARLPDDPSAAAAERLARRVAGG